MRVVVIVLVLGCVASQVASGPLDSKTPSLPKEFTLCKNGDDICLLPAIESALHMLKNGLPRIGALPMDPLHITEMSINQGTGPVSLNLTFNNLNVLGISSDHSKLYSAKGEFGDKTYRLELKSKIPSVMLLGDYTINGQVLILSIRGSGKENLTITDLDTTTVLTGHVITRDGVDYVNIDAATFTFTAQRMHLDFQNLFNGDRRLGDNMNVFLNENWSEVLQELKPGAEEALGQVFKEIAFRVYQKIPYRKMHLKD